MRINRLGYRSMSRYAWMAPVLVLLTLGVIYLFGNDSPDRIQTREATENFERVRLDPPAESEALQGPVALSDARRQNVLQRLSAFRADYRVVSPTVTVAALEASSASRELAQRIGGLLAQHNLGRYAAEPVVIEHIGDGGNDGLIIAVKREDRTLARTLATALSPMLSGTIRIQFDDTRRSGHLLVGVAARPRFTAEGMAVFSPEFKDSRR